MKQDLVLVWWLVTGVCYRSACRISEHECDFCELYRQNIFAYECVCSSGGLCLVHMHTSHRTTSVNRLDGAEG